VVGGVVELDMTVTAVVAVRVSVAIAMLTVVVVEVRAAAAVTSDLVCGRKVNGRDEFNFRYPAIAPS
jgi:hypothetical protein